MKISLCLSLSLCPPPPFLFIHPSTNIVFTIFQELSFTLRLSPCEDRDLSFHWWGWFQYYPNFAEFPQVMFSLAPLELLQLDFLVAGSGHFLLQQTVRPAGPLSPQHMLQTPSNNGGHCQNGSQLKLHQASPKALTKALL